MKKLILGLSCLVLATSAFSAQQWYKTNWYGERTINVIFDEPVQAVSVYLAGADKIVKSNGEVEYKCIPPNSKVYSMNFIPNSTVQSNSDVMAKLKARGIELSASYQSSANKKTPAVFTKSFTDWKMRNLHYNIVYTKENGERHQLRWQPDSRGGCTYRPPNIVN